VQYENDEALFKRLTPSHGEFDEQLAITKRNGDENTLQWALNMKEFKDWKLAVPGSMRTVYDFEGC
jgi:hypothetical protein